jgi:hypothetical protein
VSSDREERIALNESLFRAANERMSSWEERHRASATEPYYCECADPDCRQKIRLRKADYERVRSDSDRFVVVSGHEISDVETVVERHDEWLVIEKEAGVREIVEATDPRSP